MGVSLGGAALLLSESKKNVELLIVESVFPNIKTAVSNRLSALVPYSGLLSPLLTLQLKYRLRKPASWFSPVEAAKNVTQPALVLSGFDDRHTTNEDTIRLFEAFAGPKIVKMFEGIGHDDLEHFAGDEYWGVIDKFVDSNELITFEKQ